MSIAGWENQIAAHAVLIVVGRNRARATGGGIEALVVPGGMGLEWEGASGMEKKWYGEDSFLSGMRAERKPGGSERCEVALERGGH